VCDHSNLRRERPTPLEESHQGHRLIYESSSRYYWLETRILLTPHLEGYI
jgi:hypothetical protein